MKHALYERDNRSEGWNWPQTAQVAKEMERFAKDASGDLLFHPEEGRTAEQISSFSRFATVQQYKTAARAGEGKSTPITETIISFEDVEGQIFYRKFSRSEISS